MIQAAWKLAGAAVAASSLALAGISASAAAPGASPCQIQLSQYVPCSKGALEALRAGEVTVYGGIDYRAEYSAVVYALNYSEIAEALRYDPAKLLEDYATKGKAAGRRADVLLNQPYGIAAGESASVYAYADLAAGSADISAILSGVNKERAKAGLYPLQLDEALSYCACVRAEDLRTSFSHCRPDGSMGMDLILQADPGSTAQGENIAMGQASGALAQAAWLRSAGHRANILSSSFTRIGIGVSGDHYVQLFSN